MEVTRALLLTLAVTSAGACGGPVSARSSAAAATTPATIIRWALGSDQRGDYADAAGAYLLLLPKAPRSKENPLEHGTRATADCLPATSILPSPLGALVFLILDGGLHVLRQPGARPERLSGNDPALRPQRLLGFRAEASPTQILAAALPEGSREVEIWSFTVSEPEATILHRERIMSADPAFASKEAFFATFTSPRCLPGGRACLVLSHDGRQRYVDVESERSAKPEALLALGSTDVLDVAWSSARATSLVLLVGCAAR